MNQRHYNFIDQTCLQMDTFLRTVFAHKKSNLRASPADKIKEPILSEAEKKHSAALMRINHTGEVCAQALYQGQALTARNQNIRVKMQQSAEEENDHLAWCEERLQELHSRSSYLNLFFYLGSLALGATAGLIGDQWSLGFLAETEKQVGLHLSRHLQQLPEADSKSRLIVQQMREEEERHELAAYAAGAKILPDWIKQLMQFSSKLMTTSSYWF